MPTERARVSALATWVGQQLKAVKALLPTARTVDATLGAALAINATRDVTITWPTALPDATYLCWAIPYGANGVGGGILTVKSQTATGCVITVRAQAALTTTFSFRVYALKVP